MYVGAGFSFDVVNDSCLYAFNPDGSIKWRFKTLGGVFSSPSIGPDGTIYFGSLDSRLYAIEDSVTYAKLKWATYLGTMVYSSPAIGADGTIYVGSLDFNLYAVRPDGNIKWKYKTHWCVFSSPAIGPAGEIYVGSKDHNLYALEDSVTYAKLKWNYATGVFNDGHFVDSSPAIGSDNTVYVGTDPYGGAGKDRPPADTVLFAVKPDGSLKWRLHLPDGAESSPAIGPDGTIYVGSFDCGLFAVRDSGTAGVIKWRFPTRGWVDGSPIVDGCGTVYVGSRDSTLYAINPDGSLRWSFRAAGPIEGSPSIDSRGTLYIGDLAGNFYALGNSGPDAGVVSIDLPADVRSDSTYVPSVVVRNFRSIPRSFNVSFIIRKNSDPVYADTVSVNQLAETTSVKLNFAPWTVWPDTGTVYTAFAAVLGAGDGNPYNDTLTAQSRSHGATSGAPKGEPKALFSLEQCFPNPFRSATSIRFTIPERARVSLKIYNVSGQLVRILLDRELPPGVYSDARWDGRDGKGRRAVPGVYLYRLDTPLHSETKKMILLH